MQFNYHTCCFMFSLMVGFFTIIQILIFNPKTDYISKWSTTEVDSLDHIQNRILRIWKEGIQPALTRNNFNTYSRCLTTLFIFTAIFGFEAWIKRSFLSVLSDSKIEIQSSSQRLQIETKLLHNFASFRRCVMQVTFSVDILLDSSSCSILELTVHNKMKDQQICNIISSLVILSPGYRWYCGSFLWKWIKNNPFLDSSFLNS